MGLTTLSSTLDTETESADGAECLFGQRLLRDLRESWTALMIKSWRHALFHPREVHFAGD